MVDIVTRVNNVVNGFVWGPFGLALLLCTGLWLSVRTGFFQFRRMGYWLKHTIGAIFTNKDVTAHTSKEDMAISQFQSMCTALAGTIGTGNIVGVATAIVSGGPGAIFWMWVMALLGMMTSFAENVLGVYYRRKNEKGEWNGGAMYYLTDGLGAKPGCKAVGRVLAVLFACFCILASFGIGNMSQINSIAGNMNAAFHLPYLATGLALMVVTALIVIGGLKRVAAVTEKLVPLMALFYVAGALIIVVMHAGNIPAALAAIFKGAFNLNAAGGGALGYGISQTITWGFKRGAFSNEAGLGSAVMVNSASNVKEPVHQGMWGVFEVFADTIVVCTLTALVILTTGVVDLQSGAVLVGVQDNALVGQAITAAFGSFGPKFIAISILLFAGIISRIPTGAKALWTWFYDGGIKMLNTSGSAAVKNVILVPIVLVLFLGMIAFIVFMNDAERRIPVQYAKRVVGRKMYGGQNTFIPIKVNMSGVMPIILASSIVSLPSIIASFFTAPTKGFWFHFLNCFKQDSWVYIILYFVLIIGFAFFYVTIQYNPLEMSNNLRKNSGAIPGYRPGKPTTDYIKRVLSKVTLIGALFLGVIALFPALFGKFSGFYGLTLGGTSIMIVVGVALETTQQIESQMMMRHYKGFLE